MSLNEALKKELVVEVDQDVYLTIDNRVLVYDRYYQKKRSRSVSCMWVDDKGNVFHNFSDAYYETSAYIWKVNKYN